MSRKTRWIFAVSALLSFAVPAFAQQPSQEQISAIRGACRGDYMSVCASVPTGGSEALQCLKQHSADVSNGCRDALAAVGGSPPPVTTAAAASNPQLPQPLPPDYIAGQAAAQSSWPHTITREGATVTVYQPQAVQWPDHQTLTARAAIAIVQPGQSKPVLGTIELTLATQTDDATGIVHLSDPKLLNSHFPSLDTKQAQDLQAKISADLPTMETHQVPLGAILLSLGQPPIASVPVSNDPPEIFAADHPASLVVFDGDPVLVPVGTTGLTVAVNTNWDVFVDQGTWYLLNSGVWFSAPQRDGPYALAAQLPPEFNKLPNDGNFANVRKSIPARPAAAGYRAPQIFVSTKPAEIIVTDGAPAFQPVTGTTLQRVTNTSSVLYFDPAQSNFYVQLSGRWFSASALAGPWEYATDNLPADFALIPPDSPDAAILPSVPGTVPAQEAVLQAQIPTTTTVQRKSATLTVVWSGPPRFAPIPGTSIEAAVNTNVEMLKIGSAYYVCDKGIWYVGTTPNGPWALADSIPPAVRKIPPKSPHYHLAYAQIYAATATAVTYGYTAGYLMGYVSSGVLVYGTGYYYPPVVIAGATPIYYPYPYTYAGSVWYNSNTGAWARGGAVYGPNGGVARGGTYYNPTTGAYAAGGAVYGPNGGAGAWSAYNPSTGSYAHGSASWNNGSGSASGSYYNARTGVSGSTNQSWTPYGRNGSSTFTGPTQTVNTKSGANANGRAGGFSSTTGAEGAGYHNNVTGNNGGAVKTQNGDVYAGHDGNVYRNTGSGWQKYDNGSWNSVQPPDRNADNTNSRNNNNTNTAGNTNTNTASNNNTFGSSNNSNAPGSSNNASNSRNNNQTSGNQASNNRNSNQNSGNQASNTRNSNQTSGNQASNSRNNSNQSTNNAKNGRSGANSGARQGNQSNRNNRMESSNYHQLEQDRLGRQFGGGGGGGRFGRGGGGGGGFGGGGRFGGRR
ncbi:MAG TPA: hypothetical protein VHX39_28370 [Acetobacteraceae bacterium]|nr:hypothetical protein [Acetobacteraceae bacterium]